MASAAERDSVASEYATDYALTFETGVPALTAALGDGLALRAAIVELHLRLLEHVPDTLVARKRGADAAARVSAGARDVLAAGGVRTPAGRRALESFDAAAARAGQRAQPGDDRRPRHGDAFRRSGRAYALTPSHRPVHSS
jgi:triphosphoribosyl-dephospho-CoA synthase